MSGKASGQKSLSSKIIPKANDQRCKSDFVHVWKFVGDDINKFQFFFPTEYEYYKNDPAILFQLEDGVTPILHILCDRRKADRTLSWLKDHMQIIDQMFTIEFELEAGIFYVKEMQNMCDENNVLLVTQRAQHKAILYGRSSEKLTVLKTLFTRKKQTSPKSHSGSANHKTSNSGLRPGSAIVRGQSDMKETLQKSKHSSSLYGCSASVCVTEDFKTSDMNSTSYSSDYSLKTGHESKRSRPVSAVDHYKTPPTSPSSQYNTTPSSQYGVPPTTPSSQYGIPPTTPSSQYGVPPTTPSSRYGVPPTTPSSQYGVPPTTPSSQYGVPPTTPRSQYGVPPTTPSSQYSVPPTTPSSQYSIPPTTPSSQYSIPPTSPSSQYSIPPTSPSSQYGVPPTSPSSQYSIPPTTPSSQYGVPPTNTAASAAVSSYEEILKLEGEDVLKLFFFRREWLNKVKNSDDYDVKLKLESTGNERLTVSCKKSVAKKAHRDIAKVRERLDEFYRESFSLDTKYLQAAKIFLQTHSDRDVLFICEDENTIILIAKEYETVVNAKNLLEISIGMKRITTRDRILSDVADPSNTDVMECPSQRLSNRPDTGFPSKDYETRPTTRIKPQFTFEFLTTEGLKVKIYTASITNLSIEAIVNTANDVLVHGGGVAKVISIAAGRRLDRESRRYVEMSGKLRVTENCVTSAGDLGYRGVIHAVGPKWRDYDRKADCLKHLYLTVKNLLVTAEKEAFRTVAMPAISAGIFGVPKDCCADMYVKAVVDFSETRWSQRTLEEFHVVDIDDKILKLVEQSYKKWQRNPADLDPIKVASSFDAQSSNVQASKTDGKSLYSAESRSNVSHLKKIKYGKAGQNVAVFKINDSLKVKVSNGDLLLVDSVDAVVCSADCHLTGTGPLSQTLAAKAGQKYCKDFSKAKEDSRKKQMEIGDVFRCKGGKLSAGNVVHVVMNAIVSCLGTEMSELRYVFRRVLEMTDEWEMQKIAMPLLGTSLLRNDRDKLESCCKALCEVVLNFRSRGQKPHLLEIHLINMNPTTTELLEKVFSMAISMHSSPRRPVTAPPAIRSDKKSPINNKRSKKAMKTKPDDEVEVDKTVAFPQNRKGLKNKLSKSDHSSSSDLEYSPGLPQEYSTQIPHGIADNNSCSKCARNLITGGGTLLSCGHILCMPCFSPISDSKTCSVCDKVDVEIDDGGLRDRKKVTDCVICMDEISNPRRLGCGHEFCQTCITEMFKHKPACPICNTIYGMVCGNQPDGEMIVDKEITSLPGFEQYGTITINYSFLGGIQKETHPKPGQHYRGTHRTAYLPDNTEGRKVLDLLRLAFDRHLVFTIGTSRTTGQDNVVTWNDIHHKTKMYGGSERFGYPDDTYLSRVQEELAVKGITEDSLKNSTDC